MSKQNEIKVFKVGSKQADFTIRSITPEGGVNKLKGLVEGDAGQKVRDAFQSLKAIGGESLTLRSEGRRIKVMLAAA